MNEIRQKLPKAVTFDCAQTLVDVRWHPFTAMIDCGEFLGVPVSKEEGRRYGEMFLSRRAAYEAVNLTRDPSALADFWAVLGRDWLATTSYGVERADEFYEAAEQLAYGEPPVWFRLFDDVVPCLDRLDELGIAAVVVSNWDISLHRILRNAGIYHRFVAVIASLEEGVEKPNPRIFHIALERVGLAPEEAFHIGDHAIDDLEGATNAGIPAALILREAHEGIRSLLELPFL